MKLQKQRLWVCLDSTENPYAYFQGSRNVKIEEKSKHKERVYFEVSSLKEASVVCRKYISHFNLGSGNFIGGRIIDDDCNFVARVSYNGRVWDSENWAAAKEIEI